MRIHNKKDACVLDYVDVLACTIDVLLTMAEYFLRHPESQRHCSHERYVCKPIPRFAASPLSTRPAHQSEEDSGAEPGLSNTGTKSISINTLNGEAEKEVTTKHKRQKSNSPAEYGGGNGALTQHAEKSAERLPRDRSLKENALKWMSRDGSSVLARVSMPFIYPRKDMTRIQAYISVCQQYSSSQLVRAWST
jgi:hypothetical protein